MYIGKTPTVGNFQVCDAISVVNGQAAYTLQVGGVNVAPESANHMLVSLNGILQKPGSSFTISGSTMTFASNLATGDVIDFVQILGNVLDIGAPSDDTVTAAKLNNDVISGQTALTSAPADTDELLISDAGTIKRIDYSLIKGGKVKSINATANSTLAQVSSNSETFADVSGQDLVITPASTSSKFVLFVSTHTDTGGDGHGLTTRLTYNHSGISQTELDDNYDSYGYHARADRTNTWQSMNYYLAPSTTNEITFRLQIATVTAGESAYFNRRAYRCIAVEYE
jgi:hypothetical protein